jgi:hypothetical protein
MNYIIEKISPVGNTVLPAGTILKLYTSDWTHYIKTTELECYDAAYGLQYNVEHAHGMFTCSGIIYKSKSTVAFELARLTSITIPKGLRRTINLNSDTGNLELLIYI